MPVLDVHGFRLSDAVDDGVVLVCMMEDLAGSCSLFVDIIAILLPGQLEDDYQSFYAVLNALVVPVSLGQQIGDVAHSVDTRERARPWSSLDLLWTRLYNTWAARCGFNWIGCRACVGQSHF
ncbi:unnamed protein product [Cuscuta campestris]|uniref:Uncharacterized protein n=1 Tax=Cuscuta campestris TaxID=132261 RepID=A0A484KCG8_9ASTE|nr:unnamed protein product [Cuscuta campestris]